MTPCPAEAPKPGDYYIWDDPDRAISIRLNHAAVDRLQMEVLAGLDIGPHVGAEIGGILLGRKERVDGQTMMFIEHCEPVPCDHDKGPEYSLSGNDFDRFQAVLKGSRGFQLSVVGYFRSHNRNDLFLSSGDLELIKSCFPEPDQIFLLVKILPNRACTAGFFFWEDGRIQTEFAAGEVPLAPLEDLQLGRIPPLEDTHLEHVSPGPRRSRRSRWRLAIAMVMAAGLILIGIPVYQTAGHLLHSPKQLVSKLGLHVTRQSDRLYVTWDPHFPGITDAERAVLSIRDGNYRKALFLDAPQLRTGSVFYGPDTDSIDFALDVYNRGKVTSSEAVHVFLVALSESGSRQAPPVVKVTGNATSNAPKRDDRVVPRQAVAIPPATPADNRSPGSSPSGKPPITVIANELAPAKPSPAPQYDPPVPLLVTGKIGLPPILPLARGPEPPPVSPPKAAENSVPERRSTPDPIRSPALPAVDAYVAPEVIGRVEPRIPTDLRRMMVDAVEIEVTVSINAHGNVADAHVTSMKGALARLFLNEAVRAARMFQFRPARRNGQNVGSQMTLLFRFNKP
jgi:TonB-like protein